MQERENQFFHKAFQTLQVAVHVSAFPQRQNACRDSSVAVFLKSKITLYSDFVEGICHFLSLLGFKETS